MVAFICLGQVVAQLSFGRDSSSIFPNGNGGRFVLEVSRLVEITVDDIVCLLAWHIYCHVGQLPYQLVGVWVAAYIDIHYIVGSWRCLGNNIEILRATLWQCCRIALHACQHRAIKSLAPTTYLAKLGVEFRLGCQTVSTACICLVGADIIAVCNRMWPCRIWRRATETIIPDSHIIIIQCIGSIAVADLTIHPTGSTEDIGCFCQVNSLCHFQGALKIAVVYLSFVIHSTTNTTDDTIVVFTAFFWRNFQVAWHIAVFDGARMFNRRPCSRLLIFTSNGACQRCHFIYSFSRLEVNERKVPQRACKIVKQASLFCHHAHNGMTATIECALERIITRTDGRHQIATHIDVIGELEVNAFSAARAVGCSLLQSPQLRLAGDEERLSYRALSC